MHILSESFENVKNWLLNSNLAIHDENDENCGGVFSFFDEKANEFSFLYPEITGYFVSTLKFLNYVENDEKYSQYAKYSCDWVIQIYEKSTSPPCKHSKLDIFIILKYNNRNISF